MKTTFIIALLLNCFIAAQQQDTTKEKPVQYRRGIEIKEGNQSYEEKYFGKNLNEEKRRLFPLQGTGIWTELNPKVPRVDYLGIHFVNKDTGWAVGDLGALIKTTDGGSSWTVSETNTTTNILKVRSFNGQPVPSGVVIASGYDGLILRSTDGGESFEQITNPAGSGNDLWGLHFANDTVVWSCGTGNMLMKSTDAGLTWQRVFTPGYTANFWWIDFLNESYGFIAADGKVLRTIDGGENWEIIQAGDNQALYSIDIIDSLHIAAAGFGGTSYRGKNIYSSDGGYTWIEGGPLTFEAVNCIQYINRDTGYVVMTDVSARKTTNRGQEWTTIQGITDNYELQFIENLSRGSNNYLGYSVGTGLQINKAEIDLDLWNRLILNDNFADVSFVSEQKGFALGNVLYRTMDGGNSWESNGPGGSCVKFIDSLTGFIGNPGAIWKTIDGGDSWYITNGSNGASKIFFIYETTGWATRNNIIYKTTDKGENWFTQFTAPLSVSFTGIHFVDSLYGWASGGRPYKTIDGGNSWVQQTNTTIWNSDDVYFKSIDTGWFGKYSSINNSLFKTTDGGINWNPIPEVIGARKFYFFPDPIHWLTIGFSRYYITNNFGNSWLEFTEDVPTGLVSFSAPTNNLGFSAGSLGLILRYDDTTYVPVELSSFTANIDGNNIILNWSTSSELNNRGFEVERSKNYQISRLQDWKIIGFVEGKGTTTELQFYSFIDKNITAGKYQYRLKQIDFDGSFEYSYFIEVETGTPSEFHLSQNFPNPFNPETKIDYIIPEETIVNITLYDVTGRKIKELINEKKQPGYYTLKLEGGELSSGIYFYRLITTSGYTAVKKLIILK